MENTTNTRGYKKELNWDHQIEEKDRRNSLRDVKLNYPSWQAWRIFSLCSLALFNAKNMQHVLQIAQHVNPCYLSKLAEDFPMKRFLSEKRSYRRIRSVVQEHVDATEALTGSRQLPQELQLPRSSPADTASPGSPPTKQTVGAWGSQTSQSFWNHLFLEEARSFEKWDESLSFLNWAFLGEEKHTMFPTKH